MATSQSYKQIIADIRASRPAPIYILSGEESYYLDLIADSLQQYIIAEDERDFNQHVYYGQDADLDDIVNTARQYPVMAERKLVILREAQMMQNARVRLEKLTGYLQKPCHTTVLVVHFKGEPLKENSKLIKAAIASKGVVFVSPKVRDYQLMTHLRDYCSDHAINLHPQAAAILCESIGTNLQVLFGEIEKLRLTLPAGNHVSITVDMVTNNIGVSKQYNNFELRSALIRRDYTTCMQIARYYAANPNAKESAPEATASALFAAFANILTAHYLPDKSDASLKQNLGLPFVPQREEVKTGMRNYSAWSCLRIIHAIRNYDRNIKGIGSAQPRGELLIDLIYNIFTL